MSQTPPPEGDVASRFTALHYAILDALPEEGKELSLRPMVATVRHIGKRINSTLETGENISSAVIQAELRSLRHVGYALRQTSLGGSTTGWQRTKIATVALKAYKAKNVEAAVADLPPEPEPVTPAEPVTPLERPVIPELDDGLRNRV